jgi:hypothetical protein
MPNDCTAIVWHCLVQEPGTVIDQPGFSSTHLGEAVDRLNIRQQSTERKAGPPVAPASTPSPRPPGQVICQPAAPISRQSSRHHAETVDDIVEIVHARIA